jgi:sugar phosphate isomerase/epimerase
VALVREFVDALGPKIVSVHLKDIILRPSLTVHLDEVRPGLGGLDYHAILRELSRIGPDIPVLLEHLPAEDEYRAAAAHVQAAMDAVGLA